MDKIIYSDINNQTRQDKPIVINEEAVYQALDNLLFTSIGERLFNPEFGSKLEELLFEPIDEFTAYEIKHYVVEAIRRWEQRVELLKVAVEPDPDNNSYLISLIFKIKGLDGEYKWERIVER